MGTNFYWKHDTAIRLPTGVIISETASNVSPAVHIGKRSAAGLYCWDCGTPLRKEIPDGPSVHGHQPMTNWHPMAVHGGDESLLLTACPICLAEPVPAGSLSEQGNAGGIELGFATPLDTRPRGVATASSFSWAQEPARVLALCRDNPKDRFIRDEYDRVYSGEEFLDMILLVPLWFTSSIGNFFS